MSLPPRALEEKNDLPEAQRFFTYRYAVHRAGVFYCWENSPDLQNASEHAHNKVEDDVDMEDSQKQPDMDEDGKGYHRVPLRLLATRESYTINDVLGVTSGPPDIDHIRLPSRPTLTSASAMLHSRDAAQTQLSPTFPGIEGSKGSGSGLSPASGNRKNAVGFASAPPPYHPLKQPTNRNTVHLNSTDGLVVVSAFLPVILHRSTEGVWTADWDYEVLLSMQTHLRVTRVGVVKWRGWHGHHGGREGSPEAGVPASERALVEECLRPFNCVPVWIEPQLFGEM